VTVATSTNGNGRLGYPQPPYRPGRDGRVPFGVTVDLDGHWGYVVPSAFAPNGARHIAYNWVQWPQFLGQRREHGVGLSDLDTLMARNHEDNLIEYRYAVENMEAGYPDWKQLWDQHPGEVLVVASCGPSLTQSLPLLYKRREEFRLLCLNRSMRAFVGAGPDIAPDYFYFVERRGLSDWINDLSDGGRKMRPFDLSKVVMIGTPQADPRIVRAFHPKNRYFGWSNLGDMGHVPEMRKLTSFDCMASTTIGNVPYIAWKLGFKAVIFVGCDFSMDCRLVQNSAGNHTEIQPTRVYFDKAMQDYRENRMPPWLRQPALPELDVSGHMVLATQDCRAHADYLAAETDFLKHDAGVEVINASARGIFDYNHMGLAEALDHAKGVTHDRESPAAVGV